MLKQTAIISIAFILCGTICSAQNNCAEYEKLVDYVNCYYAEKYISKKIADIKKDTDKKDFEKYKNALKNSVNSYFDIYVSIDKSVPNSLSVYNALKKFAKYYPKSKMLWQYIDNKKGLFNENWTKTEVIDFLILLSDDEIKISDQKVNFKTFLRKTTNLLKADLQKQIPDNLFIADKVIVKQEEIAEKRAKIVENQNNANNPREHKRESKNKTTDTENNKSHLSCAWFIFAGMIVVSIWKRKWLKEKAMPFTVKRFTHKEKQMLTFEKKQETIEQISNDKEKTTIDETVCKCVFNWILKDNQNFTTFSKYILNNEPLCSLWVKNSLKHPEIRIMLEKEFLTTTVKFSPITPSTVDTKTDASRDSDLSQNHEAFNEVNSFKGMDNACPVPNGNVTASILYADAIIDGFFNKTKETPNEDTIFELRLQNSLCATFTVYHSAKQRIISNPSFLEGCNKQVLNNTQNVKTESKGTAQRQAADGKWKIIKKLNVIIN